ncbi:hypothetical protein WBG78_03915 [Chryseolinea sp. T2]|uniref:hypothetical protein n=1 Tax=Chryseolinea sp. T2 TaxID=3129255 RepID=UPI003077DAD1
MTKIENFFLNTFLGISVVGTVLGLGGTIYFNPANHLSIGAQFVALAANVTAFLIRRRYPAVSVVILTSIILITIGFMSFQPPHNITTQLTVIVLCGFIHSVMLKKKLLGVMQVVCAVCIFLVFKSKVGDPSARFAMTLGETLAASISYSILYVLLTYTTYVLKSSYDRIHGSLINMNMELHEKAYEIETQNEELMQIQDNLNEVNRNLEQIVTERTTKIQHQNEILIRYSFTNAHQLRGPLARLLGLAALHRLDKESDTDFIIKSMVNEAHAIDNVVKQISIDLESGRLDLGTEPYSKAG